MKILLTGPFGNVGLSTLEALINKGCDVRVFDIPDSPHFPKNRKIAQRYKNKVQIFWGDIRKRSDCEVAVKDIGLILHLAAIISPLADKNPKLGTEVNVGGTSNILQAAMNQQNKPDLIFTSSVAVYGDARKKQPPLLRTSDPLPPPEDEYTRQKIAAEKLVQASNLNWSILRLSFVFSPDHLEMDPLMFHVPLDTLMEPVHTKDCGVAIANTIGKSELFGKTLNIAGGEKCRTNYREFLTRMMDIFGIGMLPDEAFSKGPFHMSYMDTELSQKILTYQTRELNNLFEDAKEKKKLLSLLGRITRPIARKFLLSRSEFYKNNIRG